jgi:hypothetical protein
MTFERVLGADLVAMVCALGLLFAMGADWYSTAAGQEARRIERSTEPEGALGGEVPRAVDERARISAEDAEKNALQLTGVIDRTILAGLLLTVALTLAAAFLRAGARRFEPPLTPSALAALCACATALLLGVRMIREPGSDAATTVEAGAPIALALLGAITLAAAVALRAEEAGTAWREPPGARSASPAEAEAQPSNPGSSMRPPSGPQGPDGGGPSASTRPYNRRG